jgi:hypothetical protein
VGHISDTKWGNIARDRTKDVRDSNPNADNPLIQKNFNDWHSECIGTEA